MCTQRHAEDWGPPLHFSLVLPPDEDPNSPLTCPILLLHALPNKSHSSIMLPLLPYLLQNGPIIWCQGWLCSWILNYSCGSWHWLVMDPGQWESREHTAPRSHWSETDVPPAHWKYFPKVNCTQADQAPHVQAPISAQWDRWCLDGGTHPSLPTSTSRPMQNRGQQPQMLPTHTALCRGMPAQPWVLSFGGLCSSDLLSTSAQQTHTFYIHSNRKLLLPWWFPKDRCFNIAPNNFLLWDRDWKAQAAISKHWQGKQTCL